MATNNNIKVNIPNLFVEFYLSIQLYVGKILEPKIQVLLCSSLARGHQGVTEIHWANLFIYKLQHNVFLLGFQFISGELISKQNHWGLRIKFFCFCFFSFYQGHTHGKWMFPGQGQNQSYSCLCLCHSHSNTRSKGCLQPTPQLLATPVP